MDIKKRIDEIFPELVEIRRDFHRHPEISEKEYRTQEKICEYLETWEIEHIKGVAQTGVIAIIRGKKEGKTIGARADIDALPILESNDLPFKSVNEGVMHACGHDIHTTIHLGVAKIFKEIEEELEGNVKIFFQPAEETIGGADRMIQEGYLKNPDVDYILALHVTPHLDVGEIELKYGKSNAATNEFYINIQGKSGHAAYPDTAIDSIVVAGYIITALQTLVSRNISPVNSVVLTLGQINGGVKNNIIPGEVTMSGTFRTLDPETREFTKNRIKEIVESTARAHGAIGTVEIKDGYPALINDDKIVKILEEIGEATLGRKSIRYKEFPRMGADDFAFFLEKVQGAYYYLGSGNKEKGWVAPIHNESFIVDEGVIKIGVLMQVKTMMRLLKGEDID